MKPNKNILIQVISKAPFFLVDVDAYLKTMELLHSKVNY